MSPAAQRKILNLLGLGVRGRLAVVGVRQVRDAAKRGKLAMAVVAPDISKNSLDEILPLLRAKNIAVVEIPSSLELGAAVGRAVTGAVGVIDRDLAKGILETAKQ